RNDRVRRAEAGRVNRGRFALWLRVLLTVAVLALLTSRIDLRATWAAIRRLDPGLAALVVGLVAADRAVMIWRWNILLRARGIAALFVDRMMRAALPRAWHDTALGERVLRLADVLGAYRGHCGAIAAVSTLSIGVQVLRVLQAYVLGIAIGIDVPLSYYLL